MSLHPCLLKVQPLNSGREQHVVFERKGPPCGWPLRACDVTGFTQHSLAATGFCFTLLFCSHSLSDAAAEQFGGTNVVLSSKWTVCCVLYFLTPKLLCAVVCVLASLAHCFSHVVFCCCLARSPCTSCTTSFSTGHGSSFLRF